MKWFQIKEHSAGKKRLLLTWYLYKIFGKNILYLIATIVSFFTFLFAPKLRYYSEKYFKIIEDKSGVKPTLFNQFRHIKSYADTLADKILVFAQDFDNKKIIFEKQEDKKQLFEDINKKNGVFFIFSHIGNIEILQSFFINDKNWRNFGVNLFFSKKQSQIFNEFLRAIKSDFPIKIFYTEEMGINTGIELKENLDNGDIVFIAGDRLSENNEKKCIEAENFSHKIFLPKGTFKLAKLMNVPTYFISAIKIKDEYKIFVEKQNSLNEKELVTAYAKYIEKMILINPFQFFHFYDFFN